MTEEIEKPELCPPHLRHVQVRIQEAAEISGKDVSNIWRACEQRRLRALRWPAGSQKHWHIRLGDLVAYTGRPLSEEQKAKIERLIADAGWG